MNNNTSHNSSPLFLRRSPSFNSLRSFNLSLPSSSKISVADDMIALETTKYNFNHNSGGEEEGGVFFRPPEKVVIDNVDAVVAQTHDCDQQDQAASAAFKNLHGYDDDDDDDSSALEIEEPLDNLGILKPIAAANGTNNDCSSLVGIFEPKEEGLKMKEIIDGNDARGGHPGKQYHCCDNNYASDLMNDELLVLDLEPPTPPPTTTKSHNPASDAIDEFRDFDPKAHNRMENMRQVHPGAIVRRDSSSSSDDDGMDEYDAVAAAAIARVSHNSKPPGQYKVRPQQKQQQQQQQKQQKEDNAIARIMGYLHYHEHDRQLVQQAEDIVRDCNRQYQIGKKRKISSNLSGSIFERLVGLMGGPRFNEVFHASMSFDLSSAPHPYASGIAQPPPHTYDHHHAYAAASAYYYNYYPPPSPSSLGQDTMQVAIAYGMHVARLHRMEQEQQQAGSHTGPPLPVSQFELIQQGVENFSAMSDEERQIFWKYAMRQVD